MLPPTYQTNRFTIRPYRPSDEDRFVAMAVDPVSVQFMGGASGNDAAERSVFQSIFSIYASQAPRWFWIWGVYEAERLCAHVEIKESPCTGPGELEVVYMVHPEERRKALMTEVLACLRTEHHAWGRAIIATLSPDNQASLKALENWGISQQQIIPEPDTGEPMLKVWLSTAMP